MRLARIVERNMQRTIACIGMLDPARHDGAVYGITGPNLISFREITAMAGVVDDVPIRYVPLNVEGRYAMFDAMGVPRKCAEGMDGHPDAHLWRSEEMMAANIGFQAGYQAILTHHVEFITGENPASLRAVFERRK